MRDLIFEKQQLEGQRQSKNLTDNSIKKIPKLVDKSQEYLISPEKSKIDLRQSLRLLMKIFKNLII